jgi:hypothetical protein
VAAVTVSISVVTAILLIQKFVATWNIVPVMVFRSHCSRNTRNSNQLSVLASTIQDALNRHPPTPNSCKEQPPTEQSPPHAVLNTYMPEA